jgi:uncharacterized protein (TIGR04255 family)
LPVGDLLPGILFSALKEDHPNLRLQRLPTADIPALAAQIDPNLRLAAKYRMDEPNNPFIFQVGDRVLTVNCKKPYAGWVAFKEKILRLIELAENSGLVPQPQRHSIRYIDLLAREAAASDINMLQLDLKIGKWNVTDKPLQMRVEIPDGGHTHVVQIAWPAEVMLPDGISKGLVLDIETFATGTPTDWSDIRTKIDQLHDSSKAIFFQQLMTIETIDRLEPEY